MDRQKHEFDIWKRRVKREENYYVTALFLFDFLECSLVC